jgi:hypothetical protein
MQAQTEQLEVVESFEKGLTKSDIRNLSEEFVEKVLAEGNPLRAAEGLSAMENFLKEVKDNPLFKDYVREEAAKYPKGFVSTSGAKIECCETGTKYDYSACEDEVINSLNEQLISLKEKISEREKFLKTVPQSGLDVITENGEAVKIFPPAKSSTSSYKITLSK